MVARLVLAQLVQVRALAGQVFPALIAETILYLEP